MSAKFLHTGDEHIDNDTHGWINPATGLNTAWESNYKVLRFLAERAVEENVDFFLSAGDNFKTGRPSQEALLLFADALTPVANAGIPIVLLDGNHHMTGVSSDHRTVIHTVKEMLTARGGTVFIASEPSLIHLPDGTQVAALPWLSKNRVLNQLGKSGLTPAEADRTVADFGMAELERMAGEADSSLPLIMASHVTVDDLRIDAVAEGFSRGSETELAHLFSEPVLPRKKLDKMPFAYGALSHIHTPQKLGDSLYYAGSPNRLTFTDMRDEKGGNLVKIGKSEKLTVQKLVTPARKMATVDLDRDDIETQLSVIEPESLVLILLEPGDPETPKWVKDRVQAAGARVVDTKARPRPRPVEDRTVLPEHVDNITALRTWATENGYDNVDNLVDAAEKLEAAS